MINIESNDVRSIYTIFDLDKSILLIYKNFLLRNITSWKERQKIYNFYATIDKYFYCNHYRRFSVR